MNRTVEHLFRALMGPVALLAAVSTQAAPNPDASPSRMALREACRDADAELQRAMGALVAQRGLEGRVSVEMEIEGDRIGAVSVAGGSPVDRNDIRRAVRRMSCDGGSAGRKVVSFELNLVADAASQSTGG